jgi:hypothetical protein
MKAQHNKDLNTAKVNFKMQKELKNMDAYMRLREKLKQDKT